MKRQIANPLLGTAAWLASQRLRFDQLGPAQQGERSPLDGAAVLATIRFGAEVASPVASSGAGPSRAAGGGASEYRLQLPSVRAEEQVEVWSTAERVSRGRAGSIEWSATDDLLFASVELPNARAVQLESVVESGYAELLAFLTNSDTPHLLRVWNYVPQINRVEAGMERYRRFCRARARAFESSWGPGFETRLSASSAVGTSAGAVVVHAIAGSLEGRHWENPRQLSAYDYPDRYGPRSPSFARATSLPDELGGGLLISGTASIVGHESRHEGVLSLQLEETLSNIEALIARVRDAEGSGSSQGSLRAMRAYVRRREDFDAVESRLRGVLGEGGHCLVLQADICRAELLVEIEGYWVP